MKTPAQVLEDGKSIQIPNPATDSYFISYPEFLKYFSDIDVITKHHLIIGSHFTYGWMPTIFHFKSNKLDESLGIPSKKFDNTLKILNDAKQGERPTIEEFELLKGLLNNSLVGTSKLLHFINPNIFAIWDSRVFRYMMGEDPNYHSIGNCKNYLEYLNLCGQVVENQEFIAVKANIENQVGYAMTPFRIAELIMFHKGGK